MARSARRAVAIAVAALLGAMAAAPAWARDGREDLRAPSDPLRSSLALGFGVLSLDNDALAEFFSQRELNLWSLRYDYRVWGPFRLGARVDASQKSRRAMDVSLGSEAYPVRYTFSAFTAFGELLLRTQLPQVGPLRPHVSAGLLLSRIHAESSGYSNGYDADWQGYSPATEIVKYGHGWRAGLGLRLPIWANVQLVAEASRQELDVYDAPADHDPPVGRWDHSGQALSIGLQQRF